jgi:hypothetical protein
MTASIIPTSIGITAIGIDLSTILHMIHGIITKTVASTISDMMFSIFIFLSLHIAKQYGRTIRKANLRDSSVR